MKYGCARCGAKSGDLCEYDLWTCSCVTDNVRVRHREGASRVGGAGVRNLAVLIDGRWRSWWVLHNGLEPGEVEDVGDLNDQYMSKPQTLTAEPAKDPLRDVQKEIAAVIHSLHKLYFLIDEVRDGKKL